MSFYFLDASALVKYYVLEPGSTWVRKLVDSPGNEILLADISIAEVTAAFSVLHRTRRISKTAWGGAFDRFMYDVYYRFRIVRSSLDDFLTAAELTRKHPLKAYDAVQLAVALRYKSFLDSFRIPLVFVSGDSTLLAVAQAEGVITENPFDHVSPQDKPRP